MREGEFFMFIFYADGNDSEEKGRHQGSRKEKERLCQPRTEVLGKTGVGHPTGDRNWHLVRWEISSISRVKERS